MKGIAMKRPVEAFRRALDLCLEHKELLTARRRSFIASLAELDLGRLTDAQEEYLLKLQADILIKVSQGGEPVHRSRRWEGDRPMVPAATERQTREPVA